MTIENRDLQRRYGFYISKLELALLVAALTEGTYDSDQNSENYPFLGNPPRMQLDTGERQYDSPDEYTFEIKNQIFHHGVNIPKLFILQDKWTHVAKYLMDLAGEEVDHWGDLLSQLIALSLTGQSYDGVAFYSAIHPIKPGGAATQSNIRTVNVTDIDSTEEWADGIFDSISQLQGIVDDRGRTMNERANSFLVACRHDNQKRVAKALNLNMIAPAAGGGNVDNPLNASGFNISMNSSARLSIDGALNPNEVIITATDLPKKPFIRQEHSEFDEGLKVLGRGSEHWEKYDTLLARRHVRRAIGFGSWQTSIRVQFA